MRKILYSPGYGAGWTTWNQDGSGSKPFRKFMLEYQPIIEFLESGGRACDLNSDHPLIQQLEREAKDQFGLEYVCVIGATDLKVATVDGLVRIEEYDGFERIVTNDNDDWL